LIEYHDIVNESFTPNGAGGFRVERLDGENGLLLTPSIDHLFDRGFIISFQNNGELIVSPVAYTPSLERMGVSTRETVNVGSFSPGQQRFLEYDRDGVFLRATR
jgi:hypothetical protein